MSQDDHENNILITQSVIQGDIIDRPLLDSPNISALLGCRVLIDDQTAHHPGSFKVCGVRAAFEEAVGATGIVIPSSGNAALAAAWLAVSEGRNNSLIVVMPSDAPEVKRQRVKECGVRIIEYDRYNDDRNAIAEKTAKKHGFHVLSANNLPFIHGNATMGYRMSRKLNEMQVHADAIMTSSCTGSGAAGLALATCFFEKKPLICFAQPEGSDALVRSLSAGELKDNSSETDTICNALKIRRPYTLPFEILKDREDVRGFTFTDDAAAMMMGMLFKNHQLMAEASGVGGLAAIYENKDLFRDKTVVVEVTGKNITPETFFQLTRGANRVVPVSYTHL